MKSRIDKTRFQFEIDEENNRLWFKNGEIHRDRGLPAIIWHSGYMTWYRNGKYLRGSYEI
jgi:hypothetical protein